MSSTIILMCATEIGGLLKFCALSEQCFFLLCAIGKLRDALGPLSRCVLTGCGQSEITFNKMCAIGM